MFDPVAYSKEYYWKNRERILRKSTEWFKAHYSDPRVKARLALRAAVIHGKIKKPDKCSLCGSPVEKRKLHGHHNDHSMSLVVTWVCYDCHKAIHRRIVNGELSRMS